MCILAQFLPIFRPIGNAINPLIQICQYGLPAFADLIPFEIESVITVVIPLGIRWVGAIRHVANGIHDKTGDQSAVWIRTDHALVYNRSCSLLQCGDCRLFLFTDDTPDLSIPFCIRSLNVDDSHIRLERRHHHHLISTIGIDHPAVIGVGLL